MERRIRPTPLSRSSSHTLLSPFRKGSALAGLVALGAMFGCGVPEDSGDQSADVETRADQIVAINPTIQPDEFKYLSAITPLSTGTGVAQFDNSTVKPILIAGSAPSISGNPVVLGGVSYEGGTHWVLARGTGNNLYFGESVADEYLAPN